MKKRKDKSKKDNQPPPVKMSIAELETILNQEEDNDFEIHPGT
jgi:hypothetical protein